MASFGEGVDAVGEGVGGVVVGQVALADGGVEERVAVAVLVVEVGEAGGEDGEAWVAGDLGRSFGDLGQPFADAGLGGFELPVQVTLVAGLGRGAAGGSGGFEVGVGYAVRSAPQLDVGDQPEVEAGEVFGPAGVGVGRPGAGMYLLAEFAGEAVAGGQVGLPVGVVEELGGDAR